MLLSLRLIKPAIDIGIEVNNQITGEIIIQLLVPNPSLRIKPKHITIKEKTKNKTVLYFFVISMIPISINLDTIG